MFIFKKKSLYIKFYVFLIGLTKEIKHFNVQVHKTKIYRWYFKTSPDYAVKVYYFYLHWQT